MKPLPKLNKYKEIEQIKGILELENREIARSVLTIYLESLQDENSSLFKEPSREIYKKKN